MLLTHSPLPLHSTGLSLPGHRLPGAPRNGRAGRAMVQTQTTAAAAASVLLWLLFAMLAGPAVSQGDQVSVDIPEPDSNQRAVTMAVIKCAPAVISPPHCQMLHSAALPRHKLTGNCPSLPFRDYYFDEKTGFTSYRKEDTRAFPQCSAVCPRVKGKRSPLGSLAFPASVTRPLS